MRAARLRLLAASAVVLSAPFCGPSAIAQDIADELNAQQLAAFRAQFDPTLPAEGDADPVLGVPDSAGEVPNAAVDSLDGDSRVMSPSLAPANQAAPTSDLKKKKKSKQKPTDIDATNKAVTGDAITVDQPADIGDTTPVLPQETPRPLADDDAVDETPVADPNENRVEGVPDLTPDSPSEAPGAADDPTLPADPIDPDPNG